MPRNNSLYYGWIVMDAVALTLIGVSLGASALITELWQLHLFWGLLSGLGTGVIGSVLGPAVANRWFLARTTLGDYGTAFLVAGAIAVAAALLALRINCQTQPVEVAAA